jgi:hypothetical protein
MLFYVISVSRVFAVQRLNHDPTPERDDYTDFTIALYVGSADAVVSADRLIRDVFGAMDPTVRLLLASEL